LTTPSIPKYNMHVSRHLLVYMLETKEVNLYTKKHLDTRVSIIG
jgi:hypothetical protein